MFHHALRRFVAVSILGFSVLTGLYRTAIADAPAPSLSAIHPPGGKAGTSVEVQITVSALEGVAEILCDDPRITFTPRGNQRFTLYIPRDVTPGLYDVRARGTNGLSTPRSLFVSPREVLVETDASGRDERPQVVPLDVSLCGRIEAAADLDEFRFHARAGQRVVIDCWAQRLDSTLRAVLELKDQRGQRVAWNAGYSGLDPRIDHLVPADGDFVVRISDLTYAGSPLHVYRLDIDTGPRLEYAWPNVVERGKITPVALFGRNLACVVSASHPAGLDRLDVEVKPPEQGMPGLSRSFLRPSRFAVEEFPVDLPGAVSPVLVGMTDVPVVVDDETNHLPATAQTIDVPKEVGGRLEVGDEKDWYRIQARRGEVLWLELYGERVGSPVDLDLSVFDDRGIRELIHLADSPEESGTDPISTSHSDPAGRWVAPADGHYLILVRNTIGGTARDPRRLYRLSVRREEPDFQLLAIPGAERDVGACNVGRGGRAWIELVALRRRGFSGPIRVTASGLQGGLECPDVWFGPGVERVPAIVSATPDCDLFVSGLSLTGHAETGGLPLVREARGATRIPSRSPPPSARLSGRIAVGVTPEASWSLIATPSRTQVSQGSVIDVAVAVETRQGATAGPVTLAGIDAPADPVDKVGVIPAGRSTGWYSVPVPERLAPGPYTFAVRGETMLTTSATRPGAKPVEVAAVAVSNPITVEVVPGAIDLRLDSHNPRTIRRGQVIQIRYKALRRNGFLGKIHTELAAPDGVTGLRARGVTFVGQTDTGTIQVAASEDSPLGRQPYLRLDAVGTVEDEPVHHAACYLELEITD